MVVSCLADVEEHQFFVCPSSLSMLHTHAGQFDGTWRNEDVRLRNSMDLPKLGGGFGTTVGSQQADQEH